MNFKRHRQREELGVNLTPMIDVVFLLLIFFMVSTSFNRETELVIDLPQAKGQLKTENPQELEVVIDESGEARVNGQTLVDQNIRTIQAALYRLSGGDRSRPLRIAADAQAPHASVVRVMDAAGQMGLVHMTIATHLPANADE
ncbi:MAG: biopolymer transporter ExbD [Gammaproteobacteria bacterium]|nr:MAG: biopolymer transporter ExbD [Gammaproteobacteria bacterium]